MKAALLLEPGQPFVVEDLAVDPPCAGEVRVKVAACGVCHSDWHLRTGATRHPVPVVVGHEGAGVVAEIGPEVQGLEVGDHVVLNWAPSCGDCFFCRAEQPSLCRTWVGPLWDGTMLDGSTRLHRRSKETVYVYTGLGAFAEEVVVPQACCIKVRSDVSLEVASLVGCAVATGVGAALRTARIPKGGSVAVLGCGGIGLSVILGARLAGAERIVAVDASPAKEAIARRLGATDWVAAGKQAVDGIRELTEGRGVDVAFEAVGRPEVQGETLEAARPGGQAVLVGLSPMGSTLAVPADRLTREAKTLVGSYYGDVDPARDFPRMLDWFVEGRLPLAEMISARYPLEEINVAFERMLSGEVARCIVVP